MTDCTTRYFIEIYIRVYSA